jgi:uncharacterized protein
MALLDPEAARACYPAGDPVHGFDHILRVASLAQQLALAEGADLEIVWAAALLHDAQPPIADHSPTGRSAHHLASAEFAAQLLQREGWSEPRIRAVQHCIRSHRFRDDKETPQSLEAQILFDADKLDAIGAIGAARAIAFAAQRGLPAYALPSSHFIDHGVTEAGELYSAFHEYLFKLIKLKDRLHTQSARRLAQERHRRMEVFFCQLAAESRGEDFTLP